MVLFVKCLQQHAADRRLMSPIGLHNCELYGCATPVQGLTTHAEAHPGFLGGHSPRYWVCAHGLCSHPPSPSFALTVSVYAAANNQHNLDAEISDVLTETSFYKAIVLARGTVSVVDSDGKCWTRIWCCAFDAIIGWTECLFCGVIGAFSSFITL